VTTRWVVTGAAGMLGRDLLEVLADERVTGLARAELDVTDPAAVAAAVLGADVVVNAAAWTDVDGAESAEDAATRVNGDGPRVLAAACRDAGARLVHVSTDYVFDGAAATPYAEDAPLAPRSAYGRSKAAGERAVREVLPDASYVVRTAWLYGEHGGSFVKTMIDLEGRRETLDVVDDQRGQPTWSLDLARQIVALARSGAPAGTYHGTSSGETTWCGLARAVFEELGADPARVRPTTTDRFPRPAPRPAYSVLGHDGWQRAGLAPIRDWREALGQAVPRLRSPA
jgi:dTDP-4-dehydrorhamnose reductase